MSNNGEGNHVDLSEQEINELKEAFMLFDKDGSGEIDEGELKTVMNDCMGMKMTDEEVKLMLEEIDTNHNGLIDFNEFLVMMGNNWSGTADTEEDVISAFHAFDTDGSGSISTEEFRFFFSKLNWNLSDEDIDEMIAEIDQNGDGSIDYKEFAEMIFHGEYQTAYTVKHADVSNQQLYSHRSLISRQQSMLVARERQSTGLDTIVPEEESVRTERTLGHDPDTARTVPDSPLDREAWSVHSGDNSSQH
ncbi:putative Calmodulin [Blattamonas nauphoetae]|uniref:Calmodulin n=1 Tax=Blattamonas nauphoetae TaxID=2049346 RepID=A0ABQ9XWJ3_9EUKA|nr:putative Calmodulin [Blattamonas nauphoetae]